MVKKVDGSGTYSISVSVSDCVDAGCLAYISPPTSNNCWRKVKNENCNDLNWYDFHSYGVTGASPKCAVGASQALHYDILADEPPYSWCPETEAMWREIKCGGGWPSGSDGDWCKVWWLDWTGWKWRQGYWDPDQGYCIITSGEAPNNGCTVDRKESTTSGIADLCPGNTAGNGKCEQACARAKKIDVKSAKNYLL